MDHRRTGPRRRLALGQGAEAYHADTVPLTTLKRPLDKGGLGFRLPTSVTLDAGGRVPGGS